MVRSGATCSDGAKVVRSGANSSDGAKVVRCEARSRESSTDDVDGSTSVDS